MSINGFLLFLAISGLGLSMFFIGFFLKKLTKKSIKKIKDNVVIVLDKIQKELIAEYETSLDFMNQEYFDRFDQENDKVVRAMNRQIDAMNRIFGGLKAIDSRLESQEELYQKILMLQKIIAKKQPKNITK